jgi:hypothetical protein
VILVVRRRLYEFIAAPVPEVVQGMVVGLDGHVGLADRVLLGFYDLSRLPALESPHGLPSDARLECDAGIDTPRHFVFRMAFLPQTRYSWHRALHGLVGLGRVATFMRAVDSSPNKTMQTNRRQAFQFKCSGLFGCWSRCQRPFPAAVGDLRRWTAPHV